MSSEPDVEMKAPVVLVTRPKKKAKMSTSQELLKKNHGKKTTKQMIHEALKELNTRKGVSLYAIKKFVAEHNEVDTEKINHLIKRSIKTEVEGGAIVQLKGVGASGSFKLPPKSKTEKTEKKKKVPKPEKVTKTSEKAKIEKPDKPKKMKQVPAKEDKVVETKKVVEKTVSKKEKSLKKNEVEKVSKGGTKKVGAEKKVKSKMATTAAQKRASLIKRKSIGSIIKAPKMKPKAR